MTERGALLAKVAADDVPANRRRGGTMKVVLSPRTCGTTTGFMGVLTLRPGEFVSEHYHPYSDEYLYVVRGSVTVLVDGHQSIQVDAGEGLAIPRNARHRVTGTSVEQAFVVFHLCPLAPRPELGHVDTEQPPNPVEDHPRVSGSTDEETGRGD